VAETVLLGEFGERDSARGRRIRLQYNSEFHGALLLFVPVEPYVCAG
jgi:hypothetical protein